MRRVCCLFSSDYPVRPGQHIRRNRQADLLGCFEIDDEIEFRASLLIPFGERLIQYITNHIIRCIMGAIAVSKKEEEQIEKLRKELGIASKSGVIRTALKALEKVSQEEKLRREIQDSVNRCGAADREENRELVMAGVARANRSG